MNRISMKLLLAGKNHLASTSRTISLTTVLLKHAFSSNVTPVLSPPFLGHSTPILIRNEMLSKPHALHASEISLLGVFVVC
jgi:hypothetical protein